MPPPVGLLPRQEPEACVAKLWVLGTLNLTSPSADCLLSAVSQDKRLALLAYLALEGRSGPVRRERILGVFWPEKPEPRARNLLSQALCHLRKALGEGVLLTSGASDVRLDPQRIWCDAVAFQDELDEGRAERALALCRGPLLTGFIPRGLHTFIDWVDQEQLRLGNLARRSALSLSQRADSVGDHVGAVRWARWALRVAPYDERLLRHLLELLIAEGRAAEAVWEYDRFEGRLLKDLELEPDRETSRLVEHIREGREREARVIA
jgi:DNA-binding SARP family transcriptional activator